MLYREIIAVCSEINKKHKYSVWGESTVCEQCVNAGGSCKTDTHETGRQGANCYMFQPHTLLVLPVS